MTLRILATAAAAVAAGTTALALTTRPPAAAADPTLPDGMESVALPVELVPIVRETHYGVLESHAGRVVNRRSSALGFDRSGRLDEVRFDEGDRVEAGEVLARLDTREQRARRRQLAAQQQQIAARLALARVTTERRQQLRAADQLSPQQLDEATYAEAALAAELEAARAALENADVQLSLSEIRAPYAGSITVRHADEGTVVGPGEPILQLVEDGVLEVQIGVPPQLAGTLEAGSTHLLEIEGGEHRAVLHSVLATVEPDTRTVRTVFRLADADGSVRAGALARVRIANRVEGGGFWLPLTALAESRRGLWSVYAAVPDASGELRVERRQLEVIHATAERAFVRGTLEEGERVVASGVHRLVPNQRVRPAAG